MKVKLILIAVFTMIFSFSNAQDCDWEFSNVNSESVNLSRALTKPIDLGGDKYKDQVFAQGLIRNEQRFLLVTFQNEFLEHKRAKRIILVTNNRTYAFDFFKVKKSKYVLGKKQTSSDTLSAQAETIYLADQETENKALMLYLIKGEDIVSIKNEEIIFLNIDNVNLTLPQESLKKISALIKCLQ